MPGPGSPDHRQVRARAGLTQARVGRAAAFAETRGLPGLALGRETPGLRTLTVIAAGVSGLSARRALPALIVGSSVFLQQAKGPALAVLAVLVVGTLVFWRVRRRKGGAPGAWREASCPACRGVSLPAERVPALAELTEAEGVPS